MADKQDVVDRIVQNKKLKGDAKVIRLWAVAMTHYRAPIGDRAWTAIENIVGADGVIALSFLTGWCMGSAGQKMDFTRLAPELKEG